MTKLIIFDMDGTLADSWPGMQYCYNMTFRDFGREEMTEEEFRAKLEHSSAQGAAGLYVEKRQDETMEQFLNRVCI